MSSAFNVQFFARFEKKILREGGGSAYNFLRRGGGCGGSTLFLRDDLICNASVLYLQIALNHNFVCIKFHVFILINAS